MLGAHFGTFDSADSCVTDFVYSPDDGGWYIQQDKRLGGKVLTRKTVGIFQSESKAHKALEYNRVRWTKWN